MKPNQFVVLHRGGALGIGVFSELKWHKQEKEHILKQLGISCEYGEEIQYGENKGTYNTIGDREHSIIIADYIEGKGGMNKLAAKYEISSGTVHNHIKAHNNNISSKGVCDRCKRVGSEYADKWAERQKMKSLN